MGSEQIRREVMELWYRIANGDLEAVETVPRGAESDPWGKIELHLIRATAAERLGDLPRAGRVVAIAAGLALQAESAEQYARAREVEATIHWRARHLHQALAVLEEAIAHCPEGRVRAAQSAKGWQWAQQQGLFRRAAEFLEQAAAQGYAPYRLTLCRIHHAIALRDFARAGELADELGPPPAAEPMFSHVTYAWAQTMVALHGAAPDARAPRLARAFLELVTKRYHLPEAAAQAHALIAEALLLHGGAPAECRAACREALQHARALANSEIEADVQRILALVEHRAGDRAAAERAFAAAHQAARPRDLVLMRFRVACDHAKALIDAGDPQALPRIAELLQAAAWEAHAIEHPSFGWEVRVLEALADGLRRGGAALGDLETLQRDLEQARREEEISSYLHTLWSGWLEQARPALEEALRTALKREAEALQSVIAGLQSQHPEVQVARFCELLGQRLRAERLLLALLGEEPEQPRILHRQGFEAAPAAALARALLSLDSTGELCSRVLDESGLPAAGVTVATGGGGLNLDRALASARVDLAGRTAMLHPIPGLRGAVAVLYAERPRAHDLDIYRPSDLVTFATLGSSLTAILRLTPLGQSNGALQRRLTGAVTLGRITTRAPAMRRILEQVKVLRESRLPVLISGETGTGKEMLARTIHQQSRRGGPFVAFNCAAINESLAEGELFGHLRGAFTDAKRDRPGLFAAADGGTLLLDEIGDMPPALQSKLLRVLQEGVIRPVGASAPRPIDVRVIAASNVDLREAVAAKRFREDLLHRIAAIHFHLPPLRERLEDLPELVRFFLREFCAERELQQTLFFSAEALSACCRYSWPGNIRELQNAVFLAAEMRDPESGKIALSALPSSVLRALPDADPQREELLRQLFDWVRSSGLTTVRDAFVHYSIERAMEINDGGLRAAARTLGIADSTLRRLRRRLSAPAAG